MKMVRDYEERAESVGHQTLTKEAGNESSRIKSTGGG